MANNKQTPLMWAVLRGHTESARILLDGKANVQHKDSLGATALMIAIQHRQYEPLLILLNRGDKVALLADKDKNGCSPAHWAAYKGDLKSLQLLDYFGADMCSLDNQKMLPLHRATTASQHQVVQFLLEKQCDPNLRNADDESCLDIAVKNNDQAMQTVLKALASKKPHSGGEVQFGNDALDLERGTGSGKDKDSGLGAIKSAFTDKGAQKMFPCFWLICVSLAVFEYIVDLRKTSYTVAPYASMAFELGVPLSLACFFLVALSDPGKVPSKARGNSGVEEIMRALDGPMPSDGKGPDINRLCTTTWVLKGLRTKYCAQTGACVEEFDHYCVWLNCAIGKGNHRQFVLLALVEFLTQVQHLYVNYHLSTSLYPYETFGAWLYGMFTGYPLFILISVAHCLTAPWVLMLFIHQSRLIVMNMTTNEMLNAHRYEHFWVASSGMGGRMQKSYRNPFTKGGFVANCLDFWVTRRRSETPNMDATGCCSHNHGHSHGGDAHGHAHAHHGG
jgi:hypothetical protein